MKDKLKNTLEHEVELLGRSISVLAIAGLLVVGGASAALLSNFGEIDGQAQVDQAVYLQNDDGNTINDGTLTASYQNDDESFVAGQTFSDKFTAVNNADSAVEVEFSTVGPDRTKVENHPSQGIVQELYEVQEFDLYEHSYGDGADGVSDTYGVKVMPGVDEVTYVVDFDSDSEWANVEVSRENGDNYHVGYDGSDWSVLDPSGPDNQQEFDVSEVDEVRTVNYEDDQMQVTVAREVGYDQGFLVHMGVDSTEYDSVVTEEASSDEGDWYTDGSETHHESVDYTDYIGQSVDLGTEGQDYVLSTHFPINTKEEDFDFGVRLDLPEPQQAT